MGTCISRRRLLQAALVAAPSLSILGHTSPASADGAELPLPDPALFQSGDFVWPKKPGAYVPYNSGSGNTPDLDRIEWMAERDAYLDEISKLPNNDVTTNQRIQTLRQMDYREFIAVYAGDQQPGMPGVYSGGSIYVGHVGIIEVDDAKVPWVIEALSSQGVVRQSYANWLNQRTGQLVWLGRLKQLPAVERAKVVVEAKAHLGRPYQFWNFDLDDAQNFYCSKLVWLSVFRSLGFAVDGKANPKRWLWFSPKQLLYVPTIDRLHDPGPYART